MKIEEIIKKHSESTNVIVIVNTQKSTMSLSLSALREHNVIVIVNTKIAPMSLSL